ncbi:MAG TPA: hypothetical protein VF200_13425 [Woeseiaceae bacterium]
MELAAAGAGARQAGSAFQLTVAAAVCIAASLVVYFSALACLTLAVLNAPRHP